MTTFGHIKVPQREWINKMAGSFTVWAEEGLVLVDAFEKERKKDPEKEYPFFYLSPKNAKEFATNLYLMAVTADLQRIVENKDDEKDS